MTEAPWHRDNQDDDAADDALDPVEPQTDAPHDDPLSEDSPTNDPISDDAPADTRPIDHRSAETEPVDDAGAAWSAHDPLADDSDPLGPPPAAMYDDPPPPPDAIFGDPSTPPLSTPPPPGPPPQPSYAPMPAGGMPDPSRESRNLAMLAHLSAFTGFVGIPSFIGPLVIWLLQKDRDAFVAEAAREALNFNLSLLIYGIAAVVLAIVTIGLGLIVVIPVALAAFIAWVVLTAMAAVRVSNGRTYRYPLTIRLVS